MAATEAVAFTSRVATTTSNQAFLKVEVQIAPWCFFLYIINQYRSEKFFKDAFANLRREISAEMNDHAQAAGGHLALSAERSASW